LSLHCVILEGINDIDLLDIVLDDDLNILNENDGKGRDILGMISSSMATFRIKILFQKWYETRTDGLCSSNVKMTHENYKCELEQLEHPIPMVLRKIDDLEWNNEQKDATIDSLSAQLMCLEKKHRKLRKQHESKGNVDHIHKDFVNGEGKDSIESSLKEKMKIDAQIVANPDEKIVYLGSNENRERKTK
jgi:hypothetical protein